MDKWIAPSSKISIALVEARLEVGEEDLCSGWKDEKLKKEIKKSKVDSRKREGDGNGGV